MQNDTEMSDDEIIEDVSKPIWFTPVRFYFTNEII